MKKNLVEQINRTKSLMGILNEEFNINFLRSLITGIGSTKKDVLSKEITKLTGERYNLNLKGNVLDTVITKIGKKNFLTALINSKILKEDEIFNQIIKALDSNYEVSIKNFFNKNPNATVDDYLNIVTSLKNDLPDNISKRYVENFKKQVIPTPSSTPSSSSVVGATASATSNVLNRLKKYLGNNNTVANKGIRYTPTEADFKDSENLIRSSKVDWSEQQIQKAIEHIKKITSTNSKEEFDTLADTAINNMSNTFGIPKETISKNIFNFIRTKNGLRVAISLFVIFLPTVAGGFGVITLDSLNIFLRTLSPSIFANLLDKVGFEDPRTKSSDQQVKPKEKVNW